MSYIIICATALLVSGVTLFSGFGLGTILMPAFAFFFPIEVAVASTAVVHGASNIFKMVMVGRHADYGLVLRFGVTAFLAALAGAAVLGHVAGFDPLVSYTIGWKTAVITPIKLIMGLLIFVFALFELLPALRDLRFDRKYLPPGRLAFRLLRRLVRSSGRSAVGFSDQNGRVPAGFCRHQRRHRFYGRYGQNRSLRCFVFFRPAVRSHRPGSMAPCLERYLRRLRRGRFRQAFSA
jgi:hypothetical protein